MTTRFEVLDQLDRCILKDVSDYMAIARESGVLTVEDHKEMDRISAALIGFHAHVRRTVG